MERNMITCSVPTYKFHFGKCQMCGYAREVKEVDEMDEAKTSAEQKLVENNESF